MDTVDPELQKSDLASVLLAELNHHGIAGHHISSLNSFYSEGLKQIVTQVFTIESRIKNVRDKTEEDREIAEISFKVEFTDIQLERPTITNYVRNEAKPATPIECQTSDLTYSLIPYLSGRITAHATLHGDPERPVVITRTETFDRFRIAPIMCGKHTDLCNLKGLAPAQLMRINEDPHEPGGTFIIKGTEWAIDNLENITYNTFHCHKNLYQTEIARGTFLSKPGDGFENSYQCLLRYKTNGAITVEITTNKFEDLELPFYLLFRAVGMTSDRDIVDNIVYGVNNTDYVTKLLKDILHKAFRADDPVFGSLRNNYNSVEIVNSIATKITEMANPTAAHRDENVIKYINNNILQIIDRYILPHIGSTPAVRIEKMRFIGHLINKLLLVAEEIIDPTDRDSLKNKRIFAAGTSLAKTFKTDFNFAVVQPTKKALVKEFKSVPFSSVQLASVVKHAIKSEDLERMLIQAIVNGNKTITVRKNEIVNRMSTQMINYKNDLNVISTLRSIAGSNSSASKQNERADEMRRVRPGYPGYICVTQSADTGESVGQTKQMAVGASITLATSQYVVKDLLAEDPDFIPWSKVAPADVSRRGLAKIFVNGHLVGCCDNAADFAYKYRMLRRKDVIRRSTTIIWEVKERELYFWTDVGRIACINIIVYNNWREYVEAQRKKKPIEFKQWINFTKQHKIDLVSGKITIEDLIEEGVCERICAGEDENCLVCPGLDEFKANINNPLLQFTHLAAEQEIMGVVALAAPLANHSNAVRNTMFTNHRKQAAGWFSLNFPYRIDKNLTFQWYGSRPFVSGFTDNLTLPNGQQVIGGIMLYTGRNCEDSILINQGSRDLGMCAVTQYNYEQTELDKGESLGNPDYARTMDIKKESSYEHLVDGLIRPGTIIEKGTVLIGKSLKLQKPIDQFTHTDRSVVYKKEEIARVDKVYKTRNAEDKMIAKVKYSATRYIGPGDKACLTPDHDVLTNCGWVPIAEVTTDDLVACLDGNKLVYTNPSEIHEYQHDGDIFVVDSNISTKVTLNHRLYVDDGNGFGFKFPNEIADKDITFKSDAINANELYDIHVNGRKLNESEIDALLMALGYSIGNRRIDTSSPIYEKLLRSLVNSGICIQIDDEIVIPDNFLVNNGAFPDYVWKLNTEQCNSLLNYILSATLMRDVIVNKQTADDLQKLALHCGTSMIIEQNNTDYIVKLNPNNKPTRGHIEKYSGSVHCITVPTHIFYVRHNGIPHWTGNSSRTANKGIISYYLPRADMPYNEHGVVLDMIFNCHSFPTRMAINQIIEGLLGIACVCEGAFIDGTMFNQVSIDDAIALLSQYGIKYGGHQRVYSGKTGEPMDTLIFVAPMHYQRLEKFVIDEYYAVRTGPTTPLTRQPMDGKNNDGGLRMGEMEKDIEVTHGSMFALQSKFCADADGTPLYICRRCGNYAVVNKQLDIYRCKTCGDAAEIQTVASTWTTNLSFSEYNAMDLKTQHILEPLQFPVYMDKK